MTEPPDPTPAAAPTPPTSAYRSNATRARIVVGLLVGNIVLDAIALILDLYGLLLVQRIADGTAGEGEAGIYDSLVQVVAIVGLVVFILTGISFLAWLYRAVKNVEPLGGGKPRFPAWVAVAGWFIPLVNLVVPFVALWDVHRRMATPTRTGGGLIVLGWWLTYLLASAVDFVSVLLFSGSETIEQITASIVWSIAGYALSIASAVLAIVMVREVQAREEERAAAVPAAAAPVTPAPAPPAV